MKNPVQKGKRLEHKIAKLLRTKGLDRDAKRMPRSGALSHLPEDILTCLPIHIEAKNRERVQLWQWWEETTSRCHMGLNPILVISGNRRPAVAVVDLEYLFDLLKIEQELLELVAERDS